jgi:hypothetical protein
MGHSVHHGITRLILNEPHIFGCGALLVYGKNPWASPPRTPRLPTEIHSNQATKSRPLNPLPRRPLRCGGMPHGYRQAGAAVGPRNWNSGDLGRRVGARPNRRWRPGSGQMQVFSISDFPRVAVEDRRPKQRESTNMVIYVTSLIIKFKKVQAARLMGFGKNGNN